MTSLIDNIIFFLLRMQVFCAITGINVVKSVLIVQFILYYVMIHLCIRRDCL